MEFQEYNEKNVFILNAECLEESKKAIKVRVVVKDKPETFWIPQSQVHADSDVWIKGDKGKLIITKWIASERGFWEKEED